MCRAIIGMACARCCGIIRRCRGLEGDGEGEWRAGSTGVEDGVTTTGRWFGAGVQAEATWFVDCGCL